MQISKHCKCGLYLSYFPLTNHSNSVVPHLLMNDFDVGYSLWRLHTVEGLISPFLTFDNLKKPDTFVLAGLSLMWPTMYKNGHVIVPRLIRPEADYQCRLNSVCLCCCVAGGLHGWEVHHPSLLHHGGAGGQREDHTQQDDRVSGTSAGSHPCFSDCILTLNSVSSPRGALGYCFVEMTDEATAERCLRKINGKALPGANPVRTADYIFNSLLGDSCEMSLPDLNIFFCHSPPDSS